ncbi:MAG: hypothetical protein J6386_09145 [Candidatus Synoicihabitans palmerolidicus]|nr:hypothetical protein [Candidatus Synoicihabitans palmerolidicus]
MASLTFLRFRLQRQKAFTPHTITANNAIASETNPPCTTVVNSVGSNAVTGR